MFFCIFELESEKRSKRTKNRSQETKNGFRSYGRQSERADQFVGSTNTDGFKGLIITAMCASFISCSIFWKVTFWFQYSFMEIWLWFQFINQGSSDGPTRPDRFIYFLLSSSFLWFSQPKLIKSFLDYSGLSAGPKLLCLTKLNTFWKLRFLWNNNNRKSILI